MAKFGPKLAFFTQLAEKTPLSSFDMFPNLLHNILHYLQCLNSTKYTNIYTGILYYTVKQLEQYKQCM